MQTKGHAAPETRAAAERARLLIENAGALGEPPEDPLLLFSVLWGFWVANYAAFKGDVVHELANELLGLAEKQGASVPLMIGHRSLGISLSHTASSVCAPKQRGVTCPSLDAKYPAAQAAQRPNPGSISPRDC